jgi:hypothetical protein
MFAGSPTDAIPRTEQAIGTTQTIITIFFTRCKPIVFDILPKGSKFGRFFFVDYIFPDLKRENVNFHRRIPRRLLGTCGKFTVPQWIKGVIKIREVSYFAIVALATFITHTPLRVLALWNVEGGFERSPVQLER